MLMSIRNLDVRLGRLDVIRDVNLDVEEVCADFIQLEVNQARVLIVDVQVLPSGQTVVLEPADAFVLFHELLRVADGCKVHAGEWLLTDE